MFGILCIIEIAFHPKRSTLKRGPYGIRSSWAKPIYPSTKSLTAEQDTVIVSSDFWVLESQQLSLNPGSTNSCVTAGKLLNFSEPYCLHFTNETNNFTNGTYCLGLGIKKMWDKPWRMYSTMPSTKQVANYVFSYFCCCNSNSYNYRLLEQSICHHTFIFFLLS